MQFQVLFTEIDDDEVRVDGLLTDGAGEAHVATITGARSDSGLLGVIIPATLREWADALTVVDVRDNGSSVELRSDATRVLLKPVDASA